MFRVTSVTGSGSAVPPTRIRRSGKAREARGSARRSLATPTACVGTRANFRGPGFPEKDGTDTVWLSNSRSGDTTARGSTSFGAAPIPYSPQDLPAITCYRHPPQVVRICSPCSKASTGHLQEVLYYVTPSPLVRPLAFLCQFKAGPISR